MLEEARKSRETQLLCLLPAADRRGRVKLLKLLHLFWITGGRGKVTVCPLAFSMYVRLLQEKGIEKLSLMLTVTLASSPRKCFSLCLSLAARSRL